MSPDTIKAGDDSGNGMVVKYVPADGPVVYGIGVPQGWSTPLGPTWCYVVEGDVLTLIGTGCHGGAGYLEEGLEHIGYSLGAVGRVVITHGHIDHDGGCLDVLARSGAELWAHEVYGSLVGVGRSSREVEVRKRFSGFVPLEDEVLVHQIKKYEEMGRQVKVTKLITDGLSSQGLKFYYTPGHSPDELCILYQRVLFTGDHILPGVTPHPSIGLSYNSFRDALPDGYRTDNRYFGLKVYLRSLKAVSGLGEEVTPPTGHSTRGSSTWWASTVPGRSSNTTGSAVGT